MTTFIYQITPEVSPLFYIRAKTYDDAGRLALAYLIGYDRFFPLDAAARCLDARCVSGSQCRPGYWQAFDFTGYDAYFGEKIFVERAVSLPSAGVLVEVKPRNY